MLASEKVRWSLHTARLRLARKKKYCQFFTRFGKCNKDDGKCPYIHDPSKIAVCTKFLKGSCSDPNCKLTHKVPRLSDRHNFILFLVVSILSVFILPWLYLHKQVIPERMQDCSYFLQGGFDILCFCPITLLKHKFWLNFWQVYVPMRVALIDMWMWIRMPLFVTVFSGAIVLMEMRYLLEYGCHLLFYEKRNFKFSPH